MTVPPNAGQDPRDPWEEFNRNVFAFNDGFDAAILRPAAELWAKLPERHSRLLLERIRQLAGTVDCDQQHAAG